MGAGQVLDAMGLAAPHVVEAPKLDIEPAQIPRHQMAELIAMDPLQALQSAIRPHVARITTTGAAGTHATVIIGGHGLAICARKHVKSAKVKSSRRK